MKSISMKLTALMIGVFLLGSAISVGVAAFLSNNVITSQAKDILRLSELINSGDLDNWLFNQKSIITTLASVLSEEDDLSEEKIVPLFKSVVNSDEACFDVYMGFPDGTATMASQFQFDYSTWNATQRDWYKLALTNTNTSHVTTPYVDSQTGKLCISIVHAVVRNGNVLGVAAADIYFTELQDIVMSMKYNASSNAMMVNNEGKIIVHPGEYAPDPQGKFQELQSVSGGFFSQLWEKISASDGIYDYKDIDGRNKLFTSCKLGSIDWYVITATPTTEITRHTVDLLLFVIPVTLVIMLIIAIIIFLVIKKTITEPIVPLTTFMEKASTTGDISLSDADIEVIGKFSVIEDEIGRCIKYAAGYTNRINSVAHLLDVIAGGDLTQDIDLLSDRDVIGASLDEMLEHLNNMLIEIDGAATQVLAGASQIANVSQILAQGATEQASSIDVLSTTVSDISKETKEKAENGTKKMDNMVKAVSDINVASNEISKIIKVIDDIAFQTNILALNASVEAARAGVHGKGFAVVAEEVKNLANRSQKAASETNQLIANSLKLADDGAEIARETQAALESIVTTIDKMADVISGIEQISIVVQQNSATAQECAAASEQMSSQSTMMRSLIERFKIRGGESVLKLERTSRRY